MFHSIFLKPEGPGEGELVSVGVVVGLELGTFVLAVGGDVSVVLGLGVLEVGEGVPMGAFVGDVGANVVTVGDPVGFLVGCLVLAEGDVVGTGKSVGGRVNISFGGTSVSLAVCAGMRPSKRLPRRNNLSRSDRSSISTGTVPESWLLRRLLYYENKHFKNFHSREQSKVLTVAVNLSKNQSRLVWFLQFHYQRLD